MYVTQRVNRVLAGGGEDIFKGEGRKRKRKDEKGGKGARFWTKPFKG